MVLNAVREFIICNFYHHHCISSTGLTFQWHFIDPTGTLYLQGNQFPNQETSILRKSISHNDKGNLENNFPRWQIFKSFLKQ